MSSNPTLRRRQLAAELQRIREGTGLTLDDIAAQVGWSQAKLSRMFSAQVGIRPRDLSALLDVLEVTDHQRREDLAELAKQARDRGWWHRYSDVLLNPYAVFIGLEAEAASIRNYESQLVPGLLQTPEYARASIRALWVTARPSEIAKTVDVRMARQGILTRTEPSPPNLSAVLDEAILRRVVGGPEVMRQQLEQLVTVADLPNVTLQVLPFSHGAHAGMTGPFVVLSFPAPTHPDVVYIEGRAGDLYLEKERDIEDYTVAFDHLRASALGADESIAYIRAVANEFSGD